MSVQIKRGTCYNKKGEHLHTKRWFSETIGQVHLRRMQRLIYLKGHQYETTGGVDCYR